MELKDLIVIAKQIHNKELQGLDSKSKIEFSNQLRNIRNAPATLSDASEFLYNIDGMGEKDRIVKFLIFKTLVESLNDNQETNKGGKRIAPAAPAYKLNGEKVHLLINKKKLHRSVYVKGNGKAKYCKINYEFVLLSKLKNKII